MLFTRYLSQEIFHLQTSNHLKICIKLLLLMGTTQSLSKQSNFQLPTQWKQLTKTNNCILYSHTNTKNLCKGVKLANIPYKYYKIYDSRLQSSFMFTPNIFTYSGQHVESKRQNPEQQALYNVHVIVQEPKYKLSQYSLSQLFEKENVIMKLEEVILGYQFLYQKYGGFQVESHQIGWTTNFQTKVWLHSDYALNSKEKNLATSNEMLQSIFTIFSQFIPRRYKNISFKNFDEALQIIKKFHIKNQNENLRVTYGGPYNQSQINLITKTVFSPNQSIKINFLHETKNQVTKPNELTISKTNRSIQNSNPYLNQRIGPLYSTMPKKPIIDNNINQSNTKINIQSYFSNRQRFSIHSNRFGFTQEVSLTKQIHSKTLNKKREYSKSKYERNNQKFLQFPKQELKDYERLTLSVRHKQTESQQNKDLTMSTRPIIQNEKQHKQISYTNTNSTKQTKQDSFSPIKKFTFIEKTNDLQISDPGNKKIEIKQEKNTRKTLSKLDHKIFSQINVNAFEDPSAEIKTMFREKNRMKTQQTMCDSLPFDKILTPKNQITSSQKQNLPSNNKQFLIEEVVDDLQDQLDALFEEDHKKQQYEEEQINIELMNELTQFFDD